MFLTCHDCSSHCSSSCQTHAPSHLLPLSLTFPLHCPFPLSLALFLTLCLMSSLTLLFLLFLNLSLNCSVPHAVFVLLICLTPSVVLSNPPPQSKWINSQAKLMSSKIGWASGVDTQSNWVLFSQSVPHFGSTVVADHVQFVTLVFGSHMPTTTATQGQSMALFDSLRATQNHEQKRRTQWRRLQFTKDQRKRQGSTNQFPN